MKQILLFAASVSTHLQYNRPILEMLRKMGHTVHIACNFTDSNIPQEVSDAFQKELTEQKIPYHDLPFAPTLLHTIQNHKANQQLQTLLQETSFDLVHCFGTIAGYYGRAAAATSGIPIFYSALDFRVFRNGSHFLNQFFKWTEKKRAKQTSVFFASNPENASYATQKLQIGEVHTLPGTGINREAFQQTSCTREELRKQLNIPEDAIVLLSVCSLTWAEYQRAVLQAISRLPQYNLYYLLCGMGPDLDFLTKLAERLHVADRVQFLGYRTDLPDLYQAADLFCLPSKREALGIHALEAMAAGLPLLTSDRNGMQFYNDGSSKGRTYPCDDIEALTKEIRELADHADLRKKMGDANREACAAWRQEKVLPVLEETYQKYLSE